MKQKWCYIGNCFVFRLSLIQFLSLGFIHVFWFGFSVPCIEYFFQVRNMRTSVQVTTQGLLVCHRHIGKREDPGDEIWPLPRKKRTYPLSQSTFRISLSTRSSISKRTIKAKNTHTHTHTKNSTELEDQHVPKAKKKKKNVWLPLQHFLIRLLHSAIYFSD